MTLADVPTWYGSFVVALIIASLVFVAIVVVIFAWLVRKGMKGKEARIFAAAMKFLLSTASAPHKPS